MVALPDPWSALSGPRGELGRLLACALLVGVALVGGIDVLGPIPLAAHARGIHVADTGPPTQPPALAISPGAWTLVAGQSVTLSATLSGPAGCSPGAMRVAWSLYGYAAVDGVLNSSEGTRVAYTTFAGNGGPVAVSASADATITCGGTDYSTSASGAASLTILPSLALSAVTTDLDPAFPGENVDLGWQVSGGLPPYTITADFGDGSGASVTMPSPGAASVGHQFGAGRFAPTVRVVDAAGATAFLPTPNPELVAFDLAASIRGPGSAVDVGIPFSLSASVAGGFPPYSVRWSDSLGLTGEGTPWNLTAPATGACVVTLRVTDSAAVTTTVQRTFTVEPLPNLSIGARAPMWDVGVPLPLWGTVTGGVPPYALSISTNGSMPVASRTLAAGSLETSVTGPKAGPVWVDAMLLDALGAESTFGRTVARLVPPPSLLLTSSQAHGEVGLPIGLSALETGGAPPVNWTLLPSLPVQNGTAPVGVLSGPGVVHWSGAFLSSGNATVLMVAVDAAGSTAIANLTLAIAPGLTASVRANQTGSWAGGALALAGSIEGGVPPYSAAFDLSDLENHHANRSSPGTVEWSAMPIYPGYLQVRFEVSDSAGRSTVVSATVFVAPNPPAPNPPAGPSTAASSPSSTAGWLVGGGVLASMLAAAVVPRIWRRRRAHPGSSAESVAMVAVRRILQSSDGLERPTLEFLAEEEGVAPASVPIAVDRWRRAGRVRGEPGPDGEELLFWTEAAPTSSPSAPATDEVAL